MKRICILLAVVLGALCAWAETDFTFTSSADLSQTKDGFSVALAQGSGQTAPKYNVSWNTEYQPDDMRLFLGNTITVSGTGLTSIQMVFAKSCASNKEYTGLSASNGTLVSGGASENFSDWKIDTWTGNANEVVFTLTGKGQRQIRQIRINGEPIVIEEVVDILPTQEDLDGTYVYSEPTIVMPKDTTLTKKEYAFIHNNILVHCSQGSILKAEEDTDPDEEVDNSHPAYFNCNAGYELTFTATQPIKGVAIDGFVRKAFNASVNHGRIQYLTDEDYDMEGWPALVLLDVNATSVTLFCPKQLRCYEVRVFFDENPEPIYTGIESIQPSEVRSQKILRDGQLYMMYEGKMYNVQGQDVR